MREIAIPAPSVDEPLASVSCSVRGAAQTPMRRARTSSVPVALAGRPS